MQALLEQNSEIAAGPGDAVTRLRVLLEAYVAMGLDHPNAYRLVFCAPPRPGGSPTQLATAEIARQCYDRYSGIVREIEAAGRLRTPDADVAALVLWTACHGLVAMMISRPDIKWGPAKTLASTMVGGLLHGLVAA